MIRWEGKGFAFLFPAYFVLLLLLGMVGDGHMGSARDRFDAAKIKQAFARAGIEGEELYRIHQRDIDMIILDWRLPRQTGSEWRNQIL